MSVNPRRTALTRFTPRRQIYDDADAALQLKGFYDEVASPLLANILINYTGPGVQQVSKHRFARCVMSHRKRNI